MHDWSVERAGRRDGCKPLHPVHPVSDVRRPPIGAAQSSIIAFPPHARCLVLVERRDLLRSCIARWLSDFCGEFATLAVSDISTSLNDDALTQISAVLIGVGPPGWSDGWLYRQMEWLRARRADVPVMMIVDAVDASEKMAVETLAAQLGMRGYIPTSSSVDVAAAALHLVMVGGRYFPTIWDEGQSPAPSSTGLTRPEKVHEGPAKLTPREMAILNVLGQGAPNKIIAYQLGIAVSTVKAHVHNIIRKLNVCSRTEAVVVARVMQARAPCMNGSIDRVALTAHDMPHPRMPALAKATFRGRACLRPELLSRAAEPADRQGIVAGLPAGRERSGGP
jgi:DNA-binding NarL/FixJ family response regulator